MSCMAKAVVVGDIGTDHDGYFPTPIISGSPDVKIDGSAAARVGDPLLPHIKPNNPPHPRKIASGSTTVYINGKPAAMSGGEISCGGVTIGGGSVNIGDLYVPPSPMERQQPIEPTMASPVVKPKPPILPDTLMSAAGKAQSHLSRTDSSTKTISNKNKEGEVQDNEVVTSESLEDENQNIDTDIDEVYLIFSDKKMDIETFAEEAYLSNKPEIIEHILKTNPHLKKSFSQILEGMPLVVSPWMFAHEDEAWAIKQADELMTEYLTLNSEQRTWFSEHHESATNALLTAATSGLDVNEGSSENSQLAELSLGHIIAGAGAVVAGAQVQGDKVSKKMKSFAGYSRYVSEQTKGLSGQALYSNPAYKEWRANARNFQSDMKGILSEIGKPGYVKTIQAKNINRYLNIDKRQLYKAKNFSKAIAGIEMTALYKQSMQFSKMLNKTGWLVVGLGLYGNGQDIYQECNMSGLMAESCQRSATKNISSGLFNATIGYGIGIALAAIPVTGGLSILLVGAGSLAWGVTGGDTSNQVGDWMEELIFD